MSKYLVNPVHGRSLSPLPLKVTIIVNPYYINYYFLKAKC